MDQRIQPEINPPDFDPSFFPSEPETENDDERGEAVIATWYDEDDSTDEDGEPNGDETIIKMEK